MVEGPAPEDTFRAHWLAWPVQLFLSDREPDGPPVEVGLQVGDDAIALRASAGQIAVTPGPPKAPDASIAGAPYAILRVLSGRISLDDAPGYGLRVDGDLGVIRRLVGRPEGQSSDLR